MNTVILMWNPAISSYTMPRFKEAIGYYAEQFRYGYIKQNSEIVHYNLNWSVRDHDKARQGDRFFMVRVGEGNTGIVMSGYFSSKPYKGEDWSGKNRETFYMDLDVELIVDSDNAPFLSTEQLSAAIPEFNWAGGHSGQVLTEDVANRLETLWFDYLYLNPRLNNGTSAAANLSNVNLISPILRRYLNATRGNNCEKCNYNYQKIWGDNCQFENPYRCSLPAPELRGKNGDNFLQNVHCICHNCYQAIMYGADDINEEGKEYEEPIIYESRPRKKKK